jgi:hypothetical protein
MKKFIVNSAILPGNVDPKTCAIDAPKMLINAGVKNAKITSCYCCGSEGRVVFVAEAEDREALLTALNRINVPVASIMETEEVKPKM